MPSSTGPWPGAARTTSPTRRAPMPDDGLVGAVGFALDALADPVVPHPTVSDGRLELMLRSASGWSRLRVPGQDTPAAGRAAVAVRVACAYLAADDLAEARLALSAARDHLPTTPSTTAPSTTAPSTTAPSTPLPGTTAPPGERRVGSGVDRVPPTSRTPSAEATRRSPAA